jgi:hypothetical protein
MTKLSYLNCATDRFGKRRWYVRKGPKSIALDAAPGTFAFIAEYHAALAALTHRRGGWPMAALTICAQSGNSQVTNLAARAYNPPAKSLK